MRRFVFPDLAPTWRARAASKRPTDRRPMGGLCFLQVLFIRPEIFGTESSTTILTSLLFAPWTAAAVFELANYRKPYYAEKEEGPSLRQEQARRVAPI